MAKEHEQKTQDTVPGYAGPSETGAPKPPTIAEKLEGVVTGEGGSVTHPTKISYSAGAYRKPSDTERIAGRALLEGDTFKGFHRKVIVDLTEGVTQEGAFNVFKGHYPDAIQQGFKAKPITEEDATKLIEEWRKEGAIPGQPAEESDKSKKEK